MPLLDDARAAVEITAVRGGRVTTRSRFGLGAVRFGKASASTKCSWKRGSSAVSTFVVRRTTASISRRADPDRRQMRAPVPAALPTPPHAVEVAVGDEPEHHRVERVDVAAEGTREPDLVDRLDAGVVHQQARAGIGGGLRELDGPHVRLRDEDPRRAFVEDVGERPALGDDPGGALGEGAIDDPVGR